MKFSDIPNSYTEYSNGLSRVAWKERSQALVVTPYLFPYDDDDAISVILQTRGGNSINLHDGGQVLSYYWRHGIDLHQRKDPWPSIRSICGHANMLFSDGAFSKEVSKENAQSEIHSFAANLMAIASLINEYPAHFAFKPRFMANAQTPKTILRNSFSRLDVQIFRGTESTC